MRAWDLLIFFIILHMGFWLVAEFNLWQPPPVVPGMSPEEVETKVPLGWQGLVSVSALSAFVGVLGALIIRVDPLRVIGLTVFSTLYLALVYNTVSVLNSLYVPVPITAVIGVISGVILVSTLIQMMVGGWRGYV